jgi:signal peptidase I
MEHSLLVGDHLYVSKVAYGPRRPNTPLSLPFMQNMIPGTEKKSYLDWIHWDYKRLSGLSHVKRNDPVVFSFPEGDTVILSNPNLSYYFQVRELALSIKNRLGDKTEKQCWADARRRIWESDKIVVHPVDKRDNYIKRCVAIPGDTLEIKQGIIYVNHKKQEYIAGLQFFNKVRTHGSILNDKRLEDLGINAEGRKSIRNGGAVPLTHEMVKELSRNKMVDTVIRIKMDNPNPQIFPHDKRYSWSLDNYGPIYIPKKGATTPLTLENLPFYERIIDYYEDNKLQVKDSVIYINGKASDSYTFKMDYFWMMGDNRHNSLDSRYWGYVPEDHIVGKPKFIWLSLNPDKKFPLNIRFRRMFKGIK